MGETAHFSTWYHLSILCIYLPCFLHQLLLYEEVAAKQYNAAYHVTNHGRLEKWYCIDISFYQAAEGVPIPAAKEEPEVGYEEE